MILTIIIHCLVYVPADELSLHLRPSSAPPPCIRPRMAHDMALYIISIKFCCADDSSAMQILIYI